MLDEIYQYAIRNPACLAVVIRTTTIAHNAAITLSDSDFVSFVASLPVANLIVASRQEDIFYMPMSHLVAKHRFKGGFMVLVRRINDPDWWNERLLVQGSDGRSLLHLVAKHQPVDVICEMFAKLDLDTIASACQSLKRVYFERMVTDLLSVINDSPEIISDVDDLQRKLAACVDRRIHKRSWTRSRRFQDKLVSWRGALESRLSIFQSPYGLAQGSSGPTILKSP